MKKVMLLIAGCLGFTATAFAQTGIHSPLMRKTDSLIDAFMRKWGVDGGTVAITQNGKLIYNRGFGHADNAGAEPMQPYHLLRIASNSKPITGIAIMKLVENGQLRLGDTVFGPGRLLEDTYYLSAISDARIYNITVQQLLEHTAGWNRSINCSGQAGCDPIGFPLHVTSVMGEGNPVGDSTLIKFLLRQGLNFNPGSAYAYSNIGYLVLAKIIEKKTGMKYDAYVKSVVMDPLGLCDMHLGKNLKADKQEREGEYADIYTASSCYGTGQTVPWQYGGWNLEAMHAHGGWISTSEDYVRMVLAVDGLSTVPDILGAATIAQMVTPSSVNAGYAKGWSVNSSGNWWHMGSLNGTSSFMARTANGLTWAFHFNERNYAAAFSNELDALPWQCIAATPTFPAYNLFAPQTQAGNLTAVKSSATTAQLSWTAGSGDKRIVTAREDNTWKSFPLAGTAYTANAAYGTGVNLGNNTFVVYEGSGTSVTVTGLDPAKTYYFTVMEVADNAGTGNNIVYKYGCRPVASLDMAGSTSIPAVHEAAWQIYPNPVQDQLVLENNNPSLRGTTAVLTNVAGNAVSSVNVGSGKQFLDMTALPAGIYFLRLKDGSVKKVVKQ